MLYDIQKTMGKVYYCLVKDPLCRDDDRHLWVQLMRKFYSLEQHCINWSSFLNWFFKQELPSMESIRRCRQKLQERHPELRGRYYNERHKEAKSIKEWANHT